MTFPLLPRTDFDGLVGHAEPRHDVPTHLSRSQVDTQGQRRPISEGACWPWLAGGVFPANRSLAAQKKPKTVPRIRSTRRAIRVATRRSGASGISAYPRVRDQSPAGARELC